MILVFGRFFFDTGWHLALEVTDGVFVGMTDLNHK
jgi:hypothetical protein